MVWVHNEVQPSVDPVMRELLFDPPAALKHFFPTEVLHPHSVPFRVQPRLLGVRKRDWEKHVFAVRSVVYEICSAKCLGNHENAFLDLMLDYERSLRQ